jgi:hypothetical protein
MATQTVRTLQRLREVQAQLVKVRAAIDSCLENGQSYSIAGSFSANAVPLADLRKMESSLCKQVSIIRSGGAPSRTFPDFT